MEGFEFSERPHESPRRLVAVIGTVHSKEELLRDIADQLQFPDWFGWNWDALEDSLRDLTRLTSPEVVLHHERVPELPIPDLRTYLAILHTVAAFWHEGTETQTLVVSFSPESRRILSAIEG